MSWYVLKDADMVVTQWCWSGRIALVPSEWMKAAESGGCFGLVPSSSKRLHESVWHVVSIFFFFSKRLVEFSLVCLFFSVLLCLCYSIIFISQKAGILLCTPVHRVGGGAGSVLVSLTSSVMKLKYRRWGVVL